MKRRPLQDPPSAPAPGIYVAADYSGQFDNYPIHCGYVAWQRDSNGQFQIIREEQNSIAKGTIEQMNVDDVQTFAAKFGCIVP